MADKEVNTPGVESELSSSPEHKAESIKAASPASLPSMSTKPRCNRAGKRRVLTTPLLAQKAENISRLDRPTLGPRSPRLCDGFGGINQSALGDASGNLDPLHEEDRNNHSHWKNKVGHILTAKRSTSQMKEEVPTSPYRLVTIRHHQSQTTEKAESIHGLPVDEKVQDPKMTDKARPLSYDRGVTFLNISDRAEDCGTKDKTDRSKKDSAIVVNNGLGNEIVADIIKDDDVLIDTQRPITPDNAGEDTSPNPKVATTPDMSRRPSIQPRSNSKQPARDDYNTNDRKGFENEREERYRTASSETVRIYDLPSPPTIQIIPGTPGEKQITYLAGKQQDSDQTASQGFLKPSTSSRQRHNDKQIKESNPGLAILEDLEEQKRGIARRLGQYDFETQRKHSSTPTPVQGLKVTETPGKATSNFSRKESMNQMRLATRKILRQRQQGLVSSVIPSGNVAMEKVSRIPKVADLTINAGLETTTSLPASPVMKQAKGSLLPIPRRALHGDTPSSLAMHTPRKSRDESAHSNKQIDKEGQTHHFEKAKGTSVEPSTSNSCMSSSYCSSSSDSTPNTGSEAVTSQEDKPKPILLSDGYTLKQLSDSSPVHGPQLRVAPDASDLILGDTSPRRSQTRKSRSFFQDFRMSEPMFAIRNFGASSAGTNGNPPKPSGITMSQSATCLSSKLDGKSGKGVWHGDGFNDGLKSAPLLPVGESDSSTNTRRHSKSPMSSQIETAMPATRQAEQVSCPDDAREQTGVTNTGDKKPRYSAAKSIQKPPLSPGRCSSQPAMIGNPQIAPQSNSKPVTRNKTTIPIREFPSSSSLQSRFYSQSKVSIGLPRNVMRTEESMESLSRQPRKAQNSAASTQIEPTAQAFDKEAESGAAAQGGMLSPRPLNQSDPLTRQRTRDSENNLAWQKSTASQRPNDRGSKLPRKNTKSGRNMFAGFRGLFFRGSQKGLNPPNARSSVQSSRNKLMKKDVKGVQQQQERPPQQQQRQSRDSGCGNTTTSKRPPTTNRVLSPRLKPWPPAVVGGNQSTSSLVNHKSSPQLNRRRSSRRGAYQRYGVRTGKPTPCGSIGTQGIKATGSSSAEGNSDDLCNELGQFLGSSKASNLTTFTMEVLDAARREINEAKKVKIIKLAKILVETVNHAHEAEKAMLVAAQAAKQAELSCSLAQEKVLQISEIARKTLGMVQGDDNEDPTNIGRA
ncbi:hypothetical protein KEM56_006582 [Ascosphaera pollenicola]|nr:hypothetical protein KEM56_006582 [Ascosphaera pollenicola]